MSKDQITRVYRETVGLYGTEGVNRMEAVESGVATLMVEWKAGRLEVDIERYFRRRLVEADERDGRSADTIIRRAAFGDTPLDVADLDVVVTLGAGLRKQWADVSVADLTAMNTIRYRNFRQAEEAYDQFNSAFVRIREMVLEHGTFGAAYEAGGFPPAAQQDSRATA
ncbi:hypothetical protein [Plantibacter sp. YIM 135249]|uniref:hypothetical protein n=1 Tax=Plantibacter sp. YIM 135249 TaxID=3423918 RepID=UPI003D33945E